MKNAMMEISMHLTDVLIVNILVWKDVQTVLMEYVGSVKLDGHLILILIHVIL